jgi:hypothetical protein
MEWMAQPGAVEECLDAASGTGVDGSRELLKRVAEWLQPALSLEETVDQPGYVCCLIS